MDKVILLVEDNPDEQVLTLRALRGHGVDATIEVASDGVEALQHIFVPGMPVLPRFVILDLKLPRVDGFQVIDRLRGDPRTRLLPIVVFSSSAEDRDVARCYEMGVNGYVSKPVHPAHYYEAVGAILNYWMGCNEDPYRRND